MEDHFYEQAEGYIYHFAEYVKLAVELCGVLVIAWGVVIALWLYAGRIFTRTEQDFVALRLTLARYLIVALEFQLAADIISTAIAPGWDQIGKLAAIATIRTVLNYFLEQEIDAEVEAIKSGDREAFENRMEDAADESAN
ncbi:hypothetical protein LEM8419_01013 [Neolewinella maritima]|uniref:DUF1622 domain-containing protein n=1 Tax=Neolewinella maritima TaxID=1383882 RepID=A0ABM9AZ05_9BACT|nr:DUF1622 domain-containing protein [Neolewinella maritima]CAH0999713.1 hypothetical protein LEM8419_01013 [Neolewinella maritima]